MGVALLKKGEHFLVGARSRPRMALADTTQVLLTGFLMGLTIHGEKGLAGERTARALVVPG